MSPEAKLKIGKFYKTLETPGGIVQGYKEQGPYNLLVMVPSKTLVFVTKWDHFAKGAIPCLDNLYYQTILGDELVWIHPYDLVEVDSEGMPIVPDGF